MPLRCQQCDQIGLIIFQFLAICNKGPSWIENCQSGFTILSNAKCTIKIAKDVKNFGHSGEMLPNQVTLDDSHHYLQSEKLVAT